MLSIHLVCLQFRVLLFYSHTDQTMTTKLLFSERWDKINGLISTIWWLKIPTPHILGSGKLNVGENGGGQIYLGPGWWFIWNDDSNANSNGDLETGIFAHTLLPLLLHLGLCHQILCLTSLQDQIVSKFDLTNPWSLCNRMTSMQMLQRDSLSAVAGCQHYLHA